METTALAPLARPRFAARGLLHADPGSRAVVAEAVGVAFAVQDGGPSALWAHDVDVVCALLLM